MIALIDNYDSFTYNLAQYLGELGAEVEVHRHDAITPAALAAKNPSHLVISPGPGYPRDAGISLETIRTFAGRIPILGVCLGHQCIGEAFGGRIVRFTPMHGKTSPITHDGGGLFTGLPNPFRATRYHSLVVDGSDLPASLQITATTAPDLIMAVKHKHWPIFGVQFHPESILTEGGHRLLQNFLTMEA